MVDGRIERSYRVRFDEAGAGGHLRSSGYLRYAQDLAWVHSETAGFGRAWYAERGLTWLVRSIELDILDDVAYGEDLGVSTVVTGFRRVWARRRSEFAAAGSGRLAGVALIDWVLINRRGVPVRVPDEIVAVFPLPGGEFTPLRVELPDSAAEPEATTLSARQSDLDPMGHVNNAVYLDYLEEHLAAVGRRGETRARPRRYRAEFLGSAQAGLTLTCEGWPADGGHDLRLRALDGDGRDLLRARLETDPSLWVGG